MARPAGRYGSPTPFPKRRPQTTRNAIGTQLYGPAGAAVFSAPTIDVQRQALYVGTGNSYSNPPAETSDAVIAFDLASGRMLWHRQATPRTATSYPASAPTRPTARKTMVRTTISPQSPILVDLHNGQRVLVDRAEIRRGSCPRSRPRGQDAVADADRQGRHARRHHVGLRRGPGARLCRQLRRRFLRDGRRRLDPNAGGGLFALDLATGKNRRCRCRRSLRRAQYSAARRCRPRSPRFPVSCSRAG